MDLKGGFAYIDMKENAIESQIAVENALYVEGLYKSVNKGKISGKLMVLYNCGGNVQNVPVLVSCYNVIPATGTIFMRVTVAVSGGGVTSRTIYVKTDSTYYVTT